MLNPNDISTICAALQYWEEEMCPHGPSAMKPYLLSPRGTALTKIQTKNLMVSIAGCAMRYGIIAPSRTHLHSSVLFELAADAREAAPADGTIATILLPAANSDLASRA